MLSATFHACVRNKSNKKHELLLEQRKQTSVHGVAIIASHGENDMSGLLHITRTNKLHNKNTITTYNVLFNYNYL
jgi:hypothetical protein